MVAALLVTSVMVVTMMHATVMVANTGRSPRGSKSSATHRDRPDTYTQTHTRPRVDHQYTLLNQGLLFSSFKKWRYIVSLYLIWSISPGEINF